MLGEFFTPRALAKQLGTSPDRVVDLIHSGELLAIDIRGPGSRRATWRISRESIDDFVRRRASKQPETEQPARPNKSRKSAAKYVPTYY